MKPNLHVARAMPSRHAHDDAAPAGEMDRPSDVSVAELTDTGCTPPLADQFNDAESARDRQLALAVIVVFLFILGWAAFAPLDKIVRGQGRIVVASKPQIVQHLEGGIVREILVSEGQQVRAGQVLMRLSDVQATSSLQQGRSRWLALKAQQARLEAESQGLTEPRFAADVPEDLRRGERATLLERSARAGSELAALRQQESQRQAEWREAQLRVPALQGELALSQQQAGVIEGLVRKGAASRMEHLDAQSRVERLQTQVADVANALPRYQAAMREIAARLTEAGSRRRADAREELNRVNAELSRLDAAAGGDSDRLARTDVLAPTTGYVNRLNVNTQGGVVRPGEAVLEITPTEGPLQVEARVRPDDRAQLRPGLPARVEVGAYDYAVYGAIDARVTEVSADTLADENGQRYYRVVVVSAQLQTPSGPGLAASGRDLLLPGMTAQVDVVVGQRSVLSYLLSPLLRLKSEALREAR